MTQKDDIRFNDVALKFLAGINAEEYIHPLLIEHSTPQYHPIPFVSPLDSPQKPSDLILVSQEDFCTGKKVLASCWKYFVTLFSVLFHISK